MLSTSSRGEDTLEKKKRLHALSYPRLKTQHTHTELSLQARDHLQPG